MISFANPWFFLLFIPVMIIAWGCIFRTRPSIKISSVIPVRRASGKRHRLTLMECCLIAAMIFTVIAGARPQQQIGSKKMHRNGVDIILALDMSASMTTYDRPGEMNERQFVRELKNGRFANRFDTAREEIRRFIAKRPNDRIGLIGFADLAYSFVPPTTDHQILLDRLATLKPGELGNATGIASPIGTAGTRLKNAPSARRVVVLFTDGANTADNRLTPKEAAQAAKDVNVILHTVGIGSARCYAVNEFNQVIPVESDLDEKLLQDIAAISGGKYFPAADPASLGRVMDEINTLEKTDYEVPDIRLYREFAPYCALLATAFLLFGTIISAAGKIRLP